MTTNSDNDGKKIGNTEDTGTLAGYYSALGKRPAPKVVDNSESASSYVAGVRITDEIAQRKQKFNGWEKDENAIMVVRMLQAGSGDKFSETDFSEVDFSGASLGAINFAGSDLRNANFAGADLRGADLSGADLRGVNLEEANLEGANLEGAILDGAYLKNAQIVGVKMSKMALNELEKMQQMQRQAEDGTLDLRTANLKYLDLRRLDLRGVDLTGVDLSGVNLVGVNLTGVKIDPKYLDQSYLFSQGTNRTIDVKKGNTAGLDLTSANQMRSKLTEVEILRKKRQAAQETEQKVVEEISKAAEDLKRQQEQPVVQERIAEQPLQGQGQPHPEMTSVAEHVQTLSPTTEEKAEEGLSKELEFLRSRRLKQVSKEELYSRLDDVVLEKRPALKSGAKSLVTKRPRRKEELPPSKYDFPILYPVDEDEKDKGKKQTAVQEVSKVAEQVTHHVKEAFKKIMPGRKRVKKQRQRQRS